MNGIGLLNTIYNQFIVCKAERKIISRIDNICPLKVTDNFITY